MTTVKERATSFIKMFGAELALEFYHDNLIVAVKELFKNTTAESLAQLIQNSEELSDTDSFVAAASEYRGILQEYDFENLAKIVFELLTEVRPDLTKTMDIIGEPAAMWFTMNVQALRDKIVSPERYMEEADKVLMVKVTCESCEKTFRIYREDVPSMKMCPFCGSLAEAEPHAEEQPEMSEEEE